MPRDQFDAANGRARLRAARIRDQVDIVDVLAHYGYHVRPDGGHREQQFSCDLHGDGRDTRPSARVYPHSQSWYCVSTTDRVLTVDGWVPLGQTVNTPPTLDGNGVFQVPLAYMDKGVKPCVTVRSRSGYQVTLTYDHEVATQVGWVEARNLLPGDVLVSPTPIEMQFNTNTSLPCGVDDLNALKFKGYPPLDLPCTWSLDLGETMGYIFGDGWVTPRTGGSSGVVGLTSSAEDVVDARRIFGFLRRWSGGRGCEVHRQDKATTPNGQVYIQDQYVFSVGNDGFCEWFRRLGLLKDQPPQERRLPESLWGAPQEALTGFLRGLYATDGSIFRPKGRKRITVNLYSVSEGFLQDVQLILFQFGILSRLHRPAVTRPGGVWYLQLATGKDILAFREHVGVANTRKQAVLDSFVYCTRGSRSHKVIVESVTYAGVLPVADLSMPGSPSFVAGGLKVHNCFACDKTRDAIETVRAKEGLDFWGAVRKLEEMFNLAPMPVEEGYQPKDPHAEVKAAIAALDPHKTFDDDVKQLSDLLSAVSAPPSQIPMDTALSFWEGIDKVVHHVRGPKGEGGPWDERKGRLLLRKIHERLMEALKPT